MSSQLMKGAKFKCINESCQSIKLDPRRNYLKTDIDLFKYILDGIFIFHKKTLSENEVDNERFKVI